jgi:hypothetical protein
LLIPLTPETNTQGIKFAERTEDEVLKEKVKNEEYRREIAVTKME